MRSRGRANGGHARRAAGRAAALACAVALVLPAAAHATAPARIQGKFTMQLLVTRAVNVRGEHRGEHLHRTWRILPGRCDRDICHMLHLRRTRGPGRMNTLNLFRRRDGTYVGHGVFVFGLSCHGRVYRRGGRARYTIRLRATAARLRGGIRFARDISATYENPARTDSAPCLLEPSHDAARYRGRLESGAPTPPRASFTAEIGAGGAATFLDTSRKGRGPGRRVVAWRWDFRDPASGAANRARLKSPEHQFSAPGEYRVRLTATDAAGLRSTVREVVVVPPALAPPTLNPLPTTSRAPRRARRRAVRSIAAPA